MDILEVLEEIKRGEYDPEGSGDVVSFYCAEREFGVLPTPERASDIFDGRYKNDVYGTRFAEKERAFTKLRQVKRAGAAGWILPSPTTIDVLEEDGRAVPHHTIDDPMQITDYEKEFTFTTDEYDIWHVNTRWAVDVPRGYSLLYLHPVGVSTELFTVVPGIVQPQRRLLWFRVPIVVHTTSGTIQYNDPLVQVIPFKQQALSVDAHTETLPKREIDSKKR